MTWQLTPIHNGTQVNFNHDGFAPSDRRYEITRSWWEHFLISLKSYLETGKGNPGSPLGACILCQFTFSDRIKRCSLRQKGETCLNLTPLSKPNIFSI